MVMLVSVSEVICGNTGFFVRGNIYRVMLVSVSETVIMW